MIGILFRTFFLLLVCWILGLAALRAFKVNEKYSMLSISIGFAILAIALNFLYFRCDLTLITIKKIILLLSILAIPAAVHKFDKRNLKPFILAAFFLTLFFAIGYGSFLSGLGESFYIFRGNVDDQYNYISMGYGILKHNFSYFVQTSEELLFKEDNLLLQAAFLLKNDRPTISLVFSLLLKEGEGSIFWTAYLYMSFLYSMLAPAFSCFLDGAFKKDKKVVRVVFLLSYMVGFWGQLNFDNNAWSQLGGMSLILSLLLIVANEISQNSNTSKIVRGGAISLLTAACFLVYPEASLVYAGGVALFVLYFYVQRKQLHKLGYWLLIVLAAGIIIVVINSNYRNIFLFMRGQLIGGVTRISDDWKMFDSYWAGLNISDNPFINILNHIISFIGFFFVIPAADGIGTYFLIFFEIAFIISICICIVYKLKSISRSENTFLQMLIILTIYFSLIIVYLLAKKNFWVLGKVMVWFSPFLYTMIAFPLRGECRDKKKHSFYKYISIFSGLLIGLNLLFGVARMQLAWTGSSKWYNNYPIQEGLRSSAEWNLDMKKLDGSGVIRIEDNYEGHYFHYLKQTIKYAGKDYFTSKNIILPYGYGKDWGKLQNKKYDSFVYLKIDDQQQRKLKYSTNLKEMSLSDLLYQKLFLSPFDTLICDNEGFLDGDPLGVWTSQKGAWIRLIAPFEEERLIIKLTITGWSGKNENKPFAIKIGNEVRDVVLDHNGEYLFYFEKVNGNDRITFLTDQLITPFEMGLSEDNETKFGVRILAMELDKG